MHKHFASFASLCGVVYVLGCPSALAQVQYNQLNQPLMDLCEDEASDSDQVLTRGDCEKFSGRTSFGDVQVEPTWSFLSAKFYRELVHLGYADPRFFVIAKKFRAHLAHLGIPADLPEAELKLFRRDRRHRSFAPIEALPLRTTHALHLLREKEIYFVREAARWVRERPLDLMLIPDFDRDQFVELRNTLSAYLDQDMSPKSAEEMVGRACGVRLETSGEPADRPGLPE